MKSETAAGEGPILPAAPQADHKATPAEIFAFALMSVGMFMAILDIQIVASSLSQIQAGLGASNDEIAWVQTSYLVAEVVMIPLSGFLSRALSIRWIFSLSCAGFTLASVLCAMVTTIEGMIAARALQGFLGGAMIPTVFASSMLIFGRKKQAVVMMTISLLVTLAPTIGPSLGGWLTEFVSWHWLFLVNVVPGIIITVSVALLVKVDEPHFALLKKTDILGALALAIVCGGTVFMLEDGPRVQWFDEPAIRWAAMAVVAFALLLTWRLMKAEVPIVDLKPFKNPTFAAGALMGGVFGMALYGLVYLYPLFLARVAGLSSGQIGTTVFVTGLAMCLTSPLAAYAGTKIDQRFLAALGFVMLAVSNWMMSYITNEWRLEQMILPQILRGSGAMFCMLSVSTMSFAALPSNLMKDASGLFTLVRNTGGAFGIAGINIIINNRSNFHQARLAEWMNVGRDEIAARLEMLEGLAEMKGFAEPANFAIRMLAQMVQREALTMAMADCFLAFAILCALFAFVPPFLARPAAFADRPVETH